MNAVKKAELETIDPRIFRDTLGHYASGITIIGGKVDGQPIGFTCQSFYSVSTAPPLISFSVMTTSTTWPQIRPTGTFSVNVLSNSQQEISSKFGLSGIDRWAGIDRGETMSGNPVITGCLAWLDCEIDHIHRAGDHDIVIGRVKEMSPIDPAGVGMPLLYFKGRYHHLKDND